MLVVLDARIADAELDAMVDILQSYFLRRALCTPSTANYKRIMATIAKVMRENGLTAATLRDHLLALSGDSGRWPDDEEFGRAWLRAPLSEMLSNARLVHIYTRLNQTFISNKAEALRFEKEPGTEHIMPQEWRQNWPLPDGSTGLSREEVERRTMDDPASLATCRREDLFHVAGNLTLLTTELNSAQRNYGWAKKKPEMLKHSLQHINQTIATATVWDEGEIKSNGRDLLRRALDIWPR